MSKDLNQHETFMRYFLFLFSVLATTTFAYYPATQPYVDRIDNDLSIISSAIQKMQEKEVSTFTKNQTVLAIIQKDQAAKDIAYTLTELLQKQIASNDPEWTEKVKLIHKMLENIYQIEQQASVESMKAFDENYNSLKKFFKAYRSYRKKASASEKIE
jgi:hypothetical protein